MINLLLDKLKESFFSVVPIIVLVLVLNFTIAPMPFWSMVLFLVSALMIVLGIGLFNLGVDMSLIPIGEKVGSSLVKSRKLFLIVLITLFIGVFISVAEPDLIVLAGQINGVPDATIIIVVSLGVGLALVGAFLRILYQFPLSYLLLTAYSLAFFFSIFTGVDFVSIAWEAGGVTTGPIMVPFVMALGLGLASVRGDQTTEEDSFGLIALCLIGPILTVLVLGMFFAPSGGSVLVMPQLGSLKDIIEIYRANLVEYAWQIIIALFPMIFLFALFQVFRLHLPKRNILKIAIGTIYTFMGLVFFLMAANLGFMPAGYQLGSIVMQNTNAWVLILVGMAMGFFVVSAEPAVFVLKKQVEAVTEGAVSAQAMGRGLSVGVAISVGLAMVRVVTGISLLYFVLPGYVLALILTFLVPNLFTAIAFDSGAVASGPLAATFMLPFAMGASEILGGNVFTDAFGIVALVAMTPVITLQLFGLSYSLRSKRTAKEAILPTGQDTIVDLDYSGGGEKY